MTIKFLKHAVKNTLNGAKCRVYYSHNQYGKDRKECVTLFAKDWARDLRDVFGKDRIVNNTEIMTDYFEEDRVYIFKDDPLFEDALKQCRIYL